MTIFREQCSLILDRNTIVPTSDGFVGTFIPVNLKTVKWLDHLKTFLEQSKNLNVPILVEVGPYSNILGYEDLSINEKLKLHGITNLDRVGVVLSKFEMNEITYSFEIAFNMIGHLSNEAIDQLLSHESFILSAKTLTNDHARGGDVYKDVTKVIGLQLLKAEDLEIPVPEEIIEKCKSVTKSTNLPDYKISIDVSKFITDEISLGNVDLESVIKLNIAAGNGIDFNSDVHPEVVESNLKRQIGIDINECFELLEGYIAGDVSLMRDALADKRITLNGFQPILPFSLIEDYRSAVDNNFTRFDSTLERALETQGKYADLNVKTEITQVSLKGKEQTEVYYVNKVMEECTDINGETYSKGKWVKSKYFNNDKFKDYVGLLADTDVHSKAENITRRYQETRALIKKLMNHLDDSYTQAIGKLTD